MKSAGSNIGKRIIKESFILNQNKYDEWAQNSINLNSSNLLSVNNNNNPVSVLYINYYLSLLSYNLPNYYYLLFY